MYRYAGHLAFASLLFQCLTLNPDTTGSKPAKHYKEIAQTAYNNHRSNTNDYFHKVSHSFVLIVLSLTFK